MNKKILSKPEPPIKPVPPKPPQQDIHMVEQISASTFTEELRPLCPEFQEKFTAFVDEHMLNKERQLVKILGDRHHRTWDVTKATYCPYDPDSDDLSHIRVPYVLRMTEGEYETAWSRYVDRERRYQELLQMYELEEARYYDALRAWKIQEIERIGEGW